jgi:diguanylate cyclase (GGDEF)-like protein
LLLVFYFTVHDFIGSTEKILLDKIKIIERLERNSYLDDLTRISNRKGFSDGLRREIKTALRFDTPMSLIILDIDFFKQYNDALGHPAGDLCLKNVAEILTSECMHSTDIVARIGGEEFAIIMLGQNLEQSKVVGENIKKAFKRARIKHPDSTVSDYLTISAGIAELDCYDDFDFFYERADKAMYKAKLAGRNRYEVCEMPCPVCTRKTENL